MWPWPRQVGGQFVITRLILLGPIVHKNWRFYLQPFQRNLWRCKILKRIAWPGSRPFQRLSVSRRLTLDIAWKHTKFHDSIASAVPDIFQGAWNSRICHMSWARPFRGQLVINRLVLLVAKSCTKFEVCSFSRSEDI